jgi:alpha-tubulin suppressor-like RCC1 family protein
MTRWIRLTLGLGVALFVGISCHDNTEGPTDPGASETGSALATTATSPLAFTQVNAGFAHTCGVTSDSRAYCWGWNNEGQMGNGEITQDHRTPSPVIGGLRFRQISAGTFHTCGVTSGYRAYCWGDGDPWPTPVPGGHWFRQVSAAEWHTCGVTTDDQAYCWGANTNGQLGNGTTDPSGNKDPIPVAVTGGIRFREVSAGAYHSCGVTPTNSAYCWGGDSTGQLGDGASYTNCTSGGDVLPCRTRPTAVAGGYRFRQVDAGVYHTCGVTTDNRAFCWGDGRDGAIGNGTRSISSSPKRVSGVLSFQRVSAGFNRTCGATTSNRAFCWGENSEGGVGDGTTSRRLSPAAVTGGLSFKQVSTGGYHSCGATPGNMAYCWGLNTEGQLGDGTITRRLRPQAVVGPM